jgi:hypothetical protein
MAIVKIGLLAITPFILMPLMSGGINQHKAPSADIAQAVQAGVPATTKPKHVFGTTIYKTRTEVPAFIEKSPSPTKAFPSAKRPYPHAVNQIAVL